ncbi:MAG: Clp protease N-terminal domain-containing protein, partial [Pseudomonadota bacterium]
MRMDKLTSKFQLAFADAQSLAVGQDHQFIEPAHLLVALLDQQGGSVRGLLTKAGVNVNLLRSKLGEALDRLPSVEGIGGDVHLGNDLAKLLNVAQVDVAADTLDARQPIQRLTQLGAEQVDVNAGFREQPPHR